MVLQHYAEVMDDRARMLKELGAVLTEVGSEHALVGGIAVGHHGRQRATIDVDILVPRNKLGPLRRALEARGYRVEVSSDMLRVFPSGSSPKQDEEAIADIVAKDAHAVLGAAFSETESATVLGHPVNVVRRGALVALKFHAVSSTTRQHADRLQDVVDIERIVTKGFDSVDASLARRIAELSYPGAADDLDRLIDDLKNGRPITL